MIDTKNPLIQRLVAGGFKVSYHEHLTGDRIVASYQASRKTPEKQTLTGRCRLGNPVKAFEDLERRVAEAGVPSAEPVSA